LGWRVAHVAPHLTSFDPGNEFAGWLFDHWGGNHGILLQSRADFSDVRRHFRKFLMVKDQAGKRYRFRFYDPRVLRSFLPACTPEELEAFFGPVLCYYTSDRGGGAVLAFGRRARGLTVHELGSQAD